jgi:AcrR family transcriptional regulator
MTEPTPEYRPAFSRRKEERPGEILQAALAEFAAKGFAATRLEDVASRAGISKGTIYLYFNSKEELFEAVVRDRIIPYFEKMEAIEHQSGKSATDILRAFLKIIHNELVSTDTRYIPKLMIGEGNRFPELAEFYFREIISRMHNLLRTVIQRGVDQGEFRAEALNWNLQAILSPALSAAMWKVVFDQFDPLDTQSMLNTHIDLLLNGLRTGAGESRE